MKQNVSHWKGYAICATLLAAIAAIFLVACPEGGGGGAGSGGSNCRIQTATESGRTVVTYTLDSTTDVGGGDLTSDISFQMVTVPVGSGLNFFTNASDNADATVDSPYSIAETELTYAVWNRVRSWALDSERGTNVYSFNAGRAGSGGSDGGPGDGSADHPVTRISWFDSVKFANALSEYCALTPVYLNGSTVMRTGTTVPTLSDTATGFRLPESNEWELAARYRDGDTNGDGDIKDSGEFYPGNFASGATADFNNAAATQRVAWYDANSMNRTHVVQGKAPNALMLYDMSGNVWERCYNVLGADGVVRGGSRSSPVASVQIGFQNVSDLNGQFPNIGVRLVR